MDSRLRASAVALLEAAPCSLEMPAGTGKTHLLAAAAAVAAGEDRRTLVLTHTNAGVDAIRRRLRTFAVPSALVRVETITSWAFTLVGAYSTIAGITVGEVPDWKLSNDYINGAIRVASASAVRDVLRSSFDHLIVDEYQDTGTEQHELVLTLMGSIEKTIVLGDRLQSIFGFGGPVVSWEEVEKSFPAFSLEIEPYRWRGHNEELGQWLLDVRPLLVEGQPFDFDDHQVTGLRFVRSNAVTDLGRVANSFRDITESVVLLDAWPADVAAHASRLGGTYAVMEDLNGNFMRQQLDTLCSEGDHRLAHWFASFAKSCLTGLAAIDGRVLEKLALGQGVGHYTRRGFEGVLAALDDLRSNPTYAQLELTAEEVLRAPGVRVYRWEAWTDTLEAIARTADSCETAHENLARIRDRLRRAGRAPRQRIASRTVLVKGLEYDHVVIANLDKMRDPRNLYVALSRARKSVTVLGRSPRVTLSSS